MRDLSAAVADVLVLVGVSLTVLFLSSPTFEELLLAFVTLFFADTLALNADVGIRLSFLKFLGGARRHAFVQLWRHILLLFGLRLLGASNAVIVLTGAFAAIVVIGGTVLENRVRRLTKVKPPFWANSGAAPTLARRLIADYAQVEAAAYLRRVSYYELLLPLALAAGLWAPAWMREAVIAADVAALCVVGSQIGRMVHLLKVAPREVQEEVTRLMKEYAPTVMLIFSGGKNSTYQANMWFEVLERIAQPVVVVFRERHHIEAFKPTKLPLVFIDSPRDLEKYVPQSVKVALYVSNVGKNIHWLRNMNCKHVFIGHGDSDKAGSAHNLMKAYDHMLVAGQGHEDRMRAAGIKVPDDYFIHVGRPQLDLFFNDLGKIAASKGPGKARA